MQIGMILVPGLNFTPGSKHDDDPVYTHTVFSSPCFTMQSRSARGMASRDKHFILNCNCEPFFQK